MIASIRHNLPYKILALVLSIALWADVKLHQEPLTIPIQVHLKILNLPKGLVATTAITQVTAVVYGPKVYASRMTADRLDAYVDLRNSAAPGQRKEEVKVVLPPNLQSVVSVLSVAPDRVDVRVRRTSTKVITVTVNWTGPPIVGSHYSLPLVRPATITAVGPDEAVNDVDHAVVTVGAGDPHVKGPFPVTPVDKSGDPVSEVILSPDAVSVEATLTATQARQQALVSPSYVGEPATGFHVERIFTDPQVVTLVGPLDTLQRLHSIRTRPLRINDARNDVVRTVEIVTPQGVTALPPTVRLRIRITSVP